MTPPPHLTSVGPPTVRVRAPGKVNLSLHVGPLGEDGYHHLTTVFQAVSLYEEVTATDADELTVTVAGPGAEHVPLDDSNLAVRAARALAEATGVDRGATLDIVKGVPVAGGMAGGSADAAATLVALDSLWSTGLGREQLTEIAGSLGADVPFALHGHTAVGTGRGDTLTAAMARGQFHWAFALRAEGLSTPDVFRHFDAAAPRPAAPEPIADTELMAALRAGDPVRLGLALSNDLQESAVALAPDLADTLGAARSAGALGVVVSGSGPTVAVLGRNRQHALALAAAMTVEGVCASVVCAAGPVAGARII